MPDDQSLEPAFIYLLADHLDATLAAGEDLIAVGRPASDGQDGKRDRESLQQIAQRIHILELALVSRLLKAREHARNLATQDHRFALLAEAFAAGMTPFQDAAIALGDTTQHEFQTGNDLAVYLRSRGLISPDAPGPGAWDPPRASEAFPILGLVPVGVILDNTAMFLDALDAEFDLYPADEGASSVETS